MTTAFEFEDPGEGIHEAEVLRVLVSEGDRVEEGQDLVVVETDKAAFELASPRSGKVRSIAVGEGDRIRVGDTLLRYEEQDDEKEHDETRREEERRAETRSSEEEPSAEARSGQEREEGREGEESEGKQRDDRKTSPRTARGREDEPVVKATPATRRLARELDVSMQQVEPTGKGGRVLPEDVQKQANGREQEAKHRPEVKPEPPRHDTPAAREDEQDRGAQRVRLRSVRRRTAERMAESWRQVARVTHHDEADISELEQLREQLAPAVEEGGGRLTLTVLALKAVSVLMPDFPRFNASYEADSQELILERRIDVGVAVDTEQGLLVPVLRDIPSKSLRTLAWELTKLAEAAREGKLRPQQMRGGTFTITNVGSIGGTGFTPIVNLPQTAILGLSRAALKPVATGTLDAPETRVRLILPLSLGFDHRVIDGAEGARFTRDLVHLLERPHVLLARI